MRCPAAIPARAGVGLKARHYDTVLADRPDIGWFEVHAENYMGAGGPPHRYLEAIRQAYPLSLHGVGLSIGGAAPLDADHLGRLKALVERYEPGLVSEHLAWSSHGGEFLNDLLPLPYTERTLAHVADHVAQVQDVLGRRVLVENPSTYVAFDHSAMTETAFLAALVRRTGCGLLLDVNNLYVSATNHGFAAHDYLDAFPLEAVGEIHLAGHAADRDEDGASLLIDAHDRPVAEAVWALFAHAVGRTGPKPTLIEWDTDVPDWPTLYAEARRADTTLAAAAPAADDETRGRHAAIAG